MQPQIWFRILDWPSRHISRKDRKTVASRSEEVTIAAAKIALKELQTPKLQKKSRPKHVSRRAQKLVDRQTGIMIKLDDPAIFSGHDRSRRDKLERELSSVRTTLKLLGYEYLIDYTHYLDH